MNKKNQNFSLFNNIANWVSLLVILLVIILGIYLIQHKSFDHDEFEAAHTAWCLKNGDLLYKDCFDSHGPLYPLVNALLWKSLSLPDGFKTIFFFRYLSLFYTAILLFLIYKIGRLFFDDLTASLGILLLVSTSIFLQKAVEIRP